MWPRDSGASSYGKSVIMHSNQPSVYHSICEAIGMTLAFCLITPFVYFFGGMINEIALSIRQTKSR